MIAIAAAALPSRRVPSVNRRNSAAASSSSGYAVGNSRASTGSSGSWVGPEKSSIASSGSTSSRGTAASLRSSSTSWRGQRAQQVGLEAGEVRDDQPAAAVPAGTQLIRRHSACLIVAQRPYSCIACTSRSISSRVPWLTTDLPSSCTSIISFSAFFFG